MKAAILDLRNHMVFAYMKVLFNLSFYIIDLYNVFLVIALIMADLAESLAINFSI